MHIKLFQELLLTKLKKNKFVHVLPLLQFTCSSADTTKEIEVEPDEMYRGIATLCGFYPNTKFACSAQAGNSAGFSGFVSAEISGPVVCSDDLESKGTDTAQCK